MTESLAPTLDKEQLRDLIADILDIDVSEVTDDAHFVQDLEVDSLMALEITVQLENRYGVKLEETDVLSVSSLRSTYDLLDEKLRALR